MLIIVGTSSLRCLTTSQQVGLLLKTLYGLCQLPTYISHKIKELGFRPCEGDHSVFVNAQGAVIVVYVDDLAIFGKSKEAMQRVKTELMYAYNMRDLGPLKSYAGIQIERCQGGVFIQQSNSTLSILDKFGVGKCDPVHVPFELKTALVP